MRKFIIKVLLFPIGLLVSYAVLFMLFDAYLNRPFKNKNAVFLWGDSQAYQGIDLNELSIRLGKKVYSSAQHGAGVYDFLLFTEQVQPKSEVIVSISKLVQVRRKKNDYNRSGLALWALKTMHDYNYSLMELSSIVQSNLKPRRNISESSDLYAYSDSMKIGLPVSHFEEYYKEVPMFLEDKQGLYLAGIQNLMRKNCKISFLEFPYHSILEGVENQSPIKEKTEALKHQVAQLFDDFRIDSIEINKDRNVFKDLSHLNGVGAKLLSTQLGLRMPGREHTTLYIAH